MQIKATEIKQVDIESIVPNPKNRNIHSDEQIERLCKMIKYSGFRNPLIVSNRSGFLVVGHGRLESAKRLGLTHVPVIYQDFENEAQEYSYIVGDNEIARWAKLDEQGLQEDIKELKLDQDFDLDLFGVENLILNIEEIDGDITGNDSNGSDPDIQEIRFILSSEQKDLLDEAMTRASSELDCIDEINPNHDGNTLTAIIRNYLGQ